MIPTKFKSLFKSFLAKPAVRRGVTIVFLATVAVFIVQAARTIAWGDVAKSVRAYDALTLASAAALSALSYLIYSCFDLLGRQYASIELSAPRVMQAAFVSFAFNQSLGSLIGAVAIRMRLYSRFGIGTLRISKIIGLSITTNWLGYCALAGILFAGRFIEVSPDAHVAFDFGSSGWNFGKNFLQVTGILMLLCVVAYFLMCGMQGGRHITLRQRRITIPTLKLALLQLGVSIIHWPTAAGIIYVLLGGRAEFATILGTLLLTAVAVVLLHIPAGLGVLETIFIGLLRRQVPTTELLAALLVFRTLYHLVPLGIAALLYLRTETTVNSPVTP